MCIANLALLVYTAIQVEQIEEAVQQLKDNNALRDPTDDMWADVKPYLVASPCVLAFGTITMALTAWKLYQVFAWDILKTIGADYRMKKRFLHYQVRVCGTADHRPDIANMTSRFISHSLSSISSFSSVSRFSSWLSLTPAPTPNLD